MRLTLFLDPLYFVGSLWGASAGTPVCRQASLPPAAVATAEIARAARSPLTVETTAFVDVSVIPMDTERVLTHQTVVVRNGRIAALGPVDKVAVPAGAVRVDGRGKYLIPGLADMHVHNDAGSVNYENLTPNLFIYLADGVTTIRYLNAVSGDPEAFEAADALSPRVFVRGFATFGTWGGIAAMDTVLGPGDPHDVRSSQQPKQTIAAGRMTAAVAAAKAAGYDFVRLSPTEVHARKTLPAIDSLLSAAHRLGLAVVTHSHEGSFTETLALGAFGGSSDHLRSFWDTLGLSSAYWDRSDTLGRDEAEAASAKIPAFAAAAKQAGVWITPTLDCIEGKYTPSPAKLTLLRHIVTALQDAGVGLLLSGDDGKNVHNELVALVRAGLSPYQALLTGTRNPAQHMGVLNESGTVAVGKRADLVLLSGNPLADIRHTREPAGVMIRGRWLDRAELDRRLLALPLSKSWPRFWLRLEKPGMPRTKGGVVLGRILGPGGVDPTEAQRQKLAGPVQRFEALHDSLAIAQSSGRDTGSAAGRMRQRLADELGAMRALLTPEQHIVFDPRARAWLREQVRQGYVVTAAGVTSMPTR